MPADLDSQVRYFVETNNLRSELAKMTSLLNVEPHLIFSRDCPASVVDVVTRAIDNGWVKISHQNQLPP